MLHGLVFFQLKATLWNTFSLPSLVFLESLFQPLPLFSLLTKNSAPVLEGHERTLCMFV